jgi:hypothetical protein
MRAGGRGNPRTPPGLPEQGQLQNLHLLRVRPSCCRPHRSRDASRENWIAKSSLRHETRKSIPEIIPPALAQGQRGRATAGELLFRHRRASPSLNGSPRFDALLGLGGARGVGAHAKGGPAMPPCRGIGRPRRLARPGNERMPKPLEDEASRRVPRGRREAPRGSFHLRALGPGKEERAEHLRAGRFRESRTFTERFSRGRAGQLGPTPGDLGRAPEWRSIVIQRDYYY